MSSERFPLTVERYGSIHVGTLFPGHGAGACALDATNAPAFGAALDAYRTEYPAGRLLLNLHHVGLMTSAALSQLVRARTLLEKEGGGLRVCAPGPEVAHVLGVTGLDAVFQPRANVREAAEAFIADLDTGRGA